MRRYSLSELNRRPGELVDHALLGPIALTKRGRDHLVMMSAEHYAKVTGAEHSSVKPTSALSTLRKSVAQSGETAEDF